MRIGYIGEGHDFLGLMSMIGQYDHDFVLINDHRLWPVTTKSELLQQTSMQRLIDYTSTLGLDHVIVPPEYEQLLQSSDMPIMSLYQDLIQQHVLPASLVHKLGIISDSQGGAESCATSLRHHAQTYTPSSSQRSNKYWTSQPRLTIRQLPEMKYHLLTYSKDDWMMRKIWKNYLRVMKDAAVDTILLASYGLRYREKVLRHHLNWKKINVVGKKDIQGLFEQATKDGESTYTITIYTTDPAGFESTFLIAKKRKWLLERGKSTSIQWKKI